MREPFGTIVTYSLNHISTLRPRNLNLCFPDFRVETVNNDDTGTGRVNWRTSSSLRMLYPNETSNAFSTQISESCHGPYIIDKLFTLFNIIVLRS